MVVSFFHSGKRSSGSVTRNVRRIADRFHYMSDHRAMTFARSQGVSLACTCARGGEARTGDGVHHGVKAATGKTETSHLYGALFGASDRASAGAWDENRAT